MKKRIIIQVHGRVQGVFYRQMAQEVARKLGIGGYADRLPNGGIIIEAEGEEAHLEIFLRWCRQGPSLSKVEMVTFEHSHEIKNFDIFEVKNTHQKPASFGFYFYRETQTSI
ncbi:MAG: acylphosphatase [Parcubacteria group bacterium]